nr:MAG TPA: hypothetical protein [Caudoviricetes sp.]
MSRLEDPTVRHLHYIDVLRYDMPLYINREITPEYIDIFNFFTFCGGRAECEMYDHYMSIGCIEDYIRFYYDAISIQYHIGNTRYYPLCYGDKDVFLVDERTYNSISKKWSKWDDLDRKQREFFNR